MNIPERIRQLTAGRPFTADTVGMSGAQILCFEDRVLKLEAISDESDHEREMLAWLEGKLPVPKILCAESRDGQNFLLMSRMEGETACSPRMLDDPGTLVKRLAEALRALWLLDTAGCPNPAYSTLDHKLRLAERRVSAHLCTLEDAEPETYGEEGFSSPEELLDWLKAHRPQENLVFSHGDFCLPNIFLFPQGGSGFIDLGRSGLADAYQDIALCYRSLKHNFGGKHGGKAHPGFSPERLFEELELSPDWEKIRYYTLLDELF
ncbi:MAG: aminoglycoside 3'-phosphotransferase [Provencibacterium sp.]|jgi:aminoglycoside phosphotransferase|nr:aminoglycoside 3'-phosphotransferase [Provencibacterium sp.]